MATNDELLTDFVFTQYRKTLDVPLCLTDEQAERMDGMLAECQRVILLDESEAEGAEDAE